MKKKMFAFNFKNLLYTLCLIISASLGAQQEGITAFHADIAVKTDGTVHITETISVWSTGQQIKRGIVREIPTRYKVKGKNTVIPFTLTGVLKDGKPVYHELSNRANGKVISLGDNSFIQHGKHTYTISYTIQRQIGFYSEYDELAWNVTGTGWRLPIAYASARITLPATIPPEKIDMNAYTGPQGFAGTQFTARKESDGSIFFQTTAPLPPYHGLTVVVIWPKGFVQSPPVHIAWWYFIRDNILLLLALVGIWLLFGFYIIVLRPLRARYTPKTIIPQFYPPENIGPAAARYIAAKGRVADATTFAAHIVHLAVRGLLTISHETSGFGSDNYILSVQKHTPEQLSPDEKGTLAQLFSRTTSVSVKKQPELVRSAMNSLQSWLQGVYSSCFMVHWRVFTCLALISISCITIPLTLHFFGNSLGLVLLASLLTLIVDYIACQTYSLEGLALKEHIEGFKMFLAATETERLAVIGTPPTKTPELYEKYLPYAIALGVEKAWSKQFTPVFESLKQQGRPYVPLWYNGHLGAFHANTFASNFSSSFSSTIAASATPPGSGSRFRDGSSGSGGGGGGGGGR